MLEVDAPDTSINPRNASIRLAAGLGEPKAAATPRFLSSKAGSRTMLPSSVT
ncbi:hypothetical protein LJR178_000982 [Variovorax sp. LjRoot178]